MTDKTDLSIAAVRKQVDTYANDKWPWLTQKQRGVLTDKLIAQIGADTLARSVELSAHGINEATLQSFVYFDASLVRTVPTAGDIVEHQLKSLEDAGHAITPELKLNTARSVAAMSDDDRIAAMPFKPDNDDSAAPAVVTPSPVKPLPNGNAAMTDEEISHIVGKPIHLLLASDRRRVLEAQKHVPQGQQQNARDADQLGQIERELSPTERLTKFRAEQALKKSA